MSEKQYQQRAVLYLDILGFKEAICQSEKDPSEFEKILKAVNSIFREKETNYNGPLKGCDIGVDISTFSDCIVVSKTLDTPNSFFCLVNMAYFALTEMIEYGFFARGAIAIGNLYHDEKVVFGQAMVDAYLMESNSAIYPRVIIKKTDLERMITDNNFNSRDDERRYYGHVTQIDNDGFVFVDFLTPNHQFDYDEGYYWLLGKTKKLIVDGLNKYKNDARVLPKYEWLKTYFNETLARLVQSEEIPTKI